VNSSEPDKNFEEIVQQERELLLEAIKEEMIQTHGHFTNALLNSELIFHRKNTTPQFIKLFRMAIKLMREEEGKSTNLERFRRGLRQKRTNIQTITHLFRDPQFAPIV